MARSNAKTATMENTNSFSSFNVVSEDSDHHFASPYRKDCFSNSKSRVYKHIMKEWKILEQSLPESIYVRVYENRIDLMRAVIVGAAGTPYHDGLFFFDIALPLDYPAHPPKVHYFSFGLTLNPNLYGNGTVCLSLLNTWSGKKTEKWDPNGSTLLQVLLSIQGLVLNEKPFFNEPSYALFCRYAFEDRSRAYNERAFSHTCQSALHLIRRPPRNFEGFIKAHFGERAATILTACGEYANGRVKVGYYGCCHRGSENNRSNAKVSAVFKGEMERLYPQLVELFRLCGAVLEASLESMVVLGEELRPPEMEQLLALEEEPQPPNTEQPVKVNERKSKTNGGIFKKAVAKIRKVLGWKKNSAKKKMNEP